MSKEAMKLALEALKEPLGFTGSSGIDAKLKEAIKALEEALAKQEQGVPEVGFGNIKQEQGEQEQCAAVMPCGTVVLNVYQAYEAGKKSALAKQEQGGWHTHDLYTDADKDRPDVICDSNGQVTLGLCKRCGRGEAELETPCDKPKRCEYCKRGLKTMCLCGLNPKQEQRSDRALADSEQLSTPCVGEPVAVHQFRNPHCADWYDGIPDHHDGHGPYEVRTLYTTPQPVTEPHKRPSRSDIKPLTDEQIMIALLHVDHETKRLPAGFRAFVRAIEAAHGIKE